MEQNVTLDSKCKQFFELPKEQTVADYIIRKCGTSQAQHPCIENPISGETIQYAQVEPFSRNVASFLLGNGFAPGDIVINVSHDGANLHVFFIGVWLAGGIIQCVYPEDIQTALTELVVSSKPKYILCDLKDADACQTALRVSGDENSAQLITFGEAEEKFISVKEIFLRKNEYLYDPSVVRLSRKDVALLLPTSGTTGKNKSVVYTHETLLRNIILFENFPFTDDPTSPTLLTGKQTHFTGSVCPLAFFAAGRYLLMMQEVSQENILRTVEKYNVRSIFSFPSYLTGLVEHPSSYKYNLRSLRFAFTGGMVVGPMFFQCLEALKLESIVTIYGMTEVGFLTANVEWQEIDGKITATLGGMNFSGGKLPPGGSVRIKDIETGDFLGAGQRGELCFKNAVVCPGYWKNEEVSRLTFQEGWISTGDLGYYDNDGNIYVLNRIKEVFKYYNNHITPSELENTLLQHPAVEEAYVVGVSDPDGGGTIPSAFVKLRNPRDFTRAKEILFWANEKFPDYKKLRGGLHVVTSFPKGRSGKILRNALVPDIIPETTGLEFSTPLSD